MKLSGETEALFAALRESAKPGPASAIEKLVENAPDGALCRINALAFAAEHKLQEEDVITAFLHGAQLGIFRPIVERSVSWLRRGPRFGHYAQDRKPGRLQLRSLRGGLRADARRNG